MTCPNCGASYTICTRVDETDGTTRRRRQCVHCKCTFWTVERLESVDRQQAFQAALFHSITEANGSREKAKNMTSLVFD